jgi:hypothetical protein
MDIVLAARPTYWIASIKVDHLHRPRGGPKIVCSLASSDRSGSAQMLNVNFS